MSEIRFICGVNPKKTRLANGKYLSRNYSQGNRVHDIEGISPCLSSQMGGAANGSVLIMKITQEERILKLASVDNITRKEHVANNTIPDTTIEVEPDKCIATRHLGRNGTLVQDIASTIQVAEIPHVTVKVGKDISYCLDSNYAKGTNTTLKSRRQLVMEIIPLNKPKHSNNRVYSVDGISPTLNTMEGGNRQPFIVEEDMKHTVAYSKSTRENHIDIRGKVDGEANSLSTGDGGSNMSTQNFVAERRYDEGIRTFKDDVCGTLRTTSECGDKIVVEVVGSIDPKQGQDTGFNGIRQGYEIYSPEGVAPAQRVTQTNKILEDTIRIRKLTPVECERLMSWPDEHTRYGQRDNNTIYELSNSARYKACGNGVVSSVPKAILDKLIPEEHIRIFSTFSGVDGSTLMLISPKYTKVAFAEFEPKTKEQHAANVLRYHYPTIPNLGDITKIEVQDVPDHDLMFISAPCQTFSIAGKRAGLSDTKGTLFYETARILEHKKPKYFLFENVAGLLSHDKGRTFEIMCEVYSSLGYELDFELLNAKYFGVAQNRQRIFMLGRLISG